MVKNKPWIEITNPNEITKSEFDELKKENNFDVFSKEQYAMSLATIQSLIKKGETEELSDDEIKSIKEGTAELRALKKYTINEMVEGRIVKSDLFVGEPQVRWHDTIEKSETGEKIEKGTFLDTELNRSLNRVGQTFEKGNKPAKADEDADKVDDAMYKAALDMVKKGDMDKNAMYKAMKGKYKEGDDKMIKSCLNKAYKAMADDYMKKAEIEVEISGDDDEEKEDNGKKEEKSKK